MMLSSGNFGFRPEGLQAEKDVTSSDGKRPANAMEAGTAQSKPKRKRPKFIRKVTCQVCGDVANDHIHYGAIACYSCRAFFRRGVNANAPYYCSQDKNCPVTKHTRKHCQFCRFQKCLGVGMKGTWVMTEEDKMEKKEKAKLKRMAKVMGIGIGGSLSDEGSMVSPMATSEPASTEIAEPCTSREQQQLQLEEEEEEQEQEQKQRQQQQQQEQHPHPHNNVTEATNLWHGQQKVNSAPYSRSPNNQYGHFPIQAPTYFPPRSLSMFDTRFAAHSETAASFRCSFPPPPPPPPPQPAQPAQPPPPVVSSPPALSIAGEESFSSVAADAFLHESPTSPSPSPPTPPILTKPFDSEERAGSPDGNSIVYSDCCGGSSSSSGNSNDGQNSPIGSHGRCTSPQPPSASSLSSPDVSFLLSKGSVTKQPVMPFTMEEANLVRNFVNAEIESTQMVPLPSDVLGVMINSAQTGQTVPYNALIEGYIICMKRIVKFSSKLDLFSKFIPKDQRSLWLSNTDMIVNIRCARMLRPGINLQAQVTHATAGLLGKSGPGSGDVALFRSPQRLEYRQIFSSPWACDARHEEQFADLMENLFHLEMDRNTTMLMSLIVLFSTTYPDVEDSRRCISIQEFFSQILYRYLCSTVGRPNAIRLLPKYMYLISQLEEMAQIMISKRLTL